MTKKESKILRIIYEIEDFAMNATLQNETEQGIDYEWLSKQRMEALKKIMEV